MDEIIKKLYFEFCLGKQSIKKKNENELKEERLHDKLKSILNQEQNKLFDEFIELVFSNVCDDLIRSFGDGIKFMINFLEIDSNSLKEKLNTK